MGSQILAKNKALATAGKELMGWGRFKKQPRELFAEMLHIWTIALRNAFMPRDAAWHAREAEYQTLTERIGPTGTALISDALAALTAASLSSRGDHLGELFNQFEAGSKSAGQFFTPYHVSSLMGKMTFTPDLIERTIAENGVIHAHEPACGAGGMIVAMAEAVEELGYDPARVLCVHATDIDRIAVEMSFVQTTLQRIPCFTEQADAIDPRSCERFDYRLPNVHYAALRMTMMTEKENA